MKHQNNQNHQPLSLKILVKKGREFARQAFWAVFPLSLLMSMLGYALQPNTLSTFSEWMDWIAILILAGGVLALSALHASILIQMNAVIHGQCWRLKKVIELGIHKSASVFLVWLLYSSIVAVSLLLFKKMGQIEELSGYPILLNSIEFIVFIIPAIWLSVYFYLALFIVVLAEHKKETPVYQRLLDYFRESIILVKGHWWQMLGLLVAISAVMAAIGGIYHLLVKEWVVFAVMFSVVARALVLPFWYGCILAMILELKAKRSLHQARLETRILKGNGASE